MWIGLYGVDDDPVSDGVEYNADAISSDFGDDVNPREGFEKVLSSGAADGYNISTIRTEEDFKLKWDSGEIQIGNVRELREFKLKLESLKN